MLLDDPPEGAGVGRAYGLALEHDRGATVQQGRVDDVGVADHPSDIRGRPVHLARLDIVKVFHCPLERHRVPAIVANGTLGPAGRTGGVEDVKRVSGLDRHAVGRDGRGDCIVPVDVAARHQRGLLLRALKDDAAIRLVLRLLDGRVEHQLVLDDAIRFDPAGRGDDDSGLSVVDAGCKLVRGETAEDHRVHRASRAQASMAVNVWGIIGM